MDVHFLLHKDYEYVCEHGLQVDSCDGSFHLDHVNAYRQTADMPVCDVVLVCLKSVNNHLLSELLPPLLGSHTVVFQHFFIILLCSEAHTIQITQHGHCFRDALFRQFLDEREDSFIILRVIQGQGLFVTAGRVRRFLCRI